MNEFTRRIRYSILDHTGEFTDRVKRLLEKLNYEYVPMSIRNNADILIILPDNDGDEFVTGIHEQQPEETLCRKRIHYAGVNSTLANDACKWQSCDRPAFIVTEITDTDLKGFIHHEELFPEMYNYTTYCYYDAMAVNNYTSYYGFCLVDRFLEFDTWVPGYFSSEHKINHERKIPEPEEILDQMSDSLSNVQTSIDKMKSMLNGNDEELLII